MHFTRFASFSEYFISSHYHIVTGQILFFSFGDSLSLRYQQHGIVKPTFIALSEVYNLAPQLHYCWKTTQERNWPADSTALVIIQSRCKWDQARETQSLVELTDKVLELN